MSDRRGDETKRLEAEGFRVVEAVAECPLCRDEIAITAVDDQVNAVRCVWCCTAFMVDFRRSEDD